MAGQKKTAKVREPKKKAPAPDYLDFIERARETYASDDLEIDDDPAVSDARSGGSDDGVWVAAWVWVPAIESKEG